MHPKSSGFTLLELSIVIVIIGLIVAGISAGSSLVRAAGLRTITSDYNKYLVAVNSFKLQYDALPGDMSNADNYWSGCGTGATTGECNGNGDGAVDSGTSLTDNEMLRFWQHLANAEVIEGTFTGSATGAGTNHAIHVAGVNAPASGLNSCVSALYRSNPGDAGNRFGFGAQSATVGLCNEGFITPTEAYNLDQKLDGDLLPRSGKLTVNNSGNCFSGSAYLLSNTENFCIAEIWFGN